MARRSKHDDFVSLESGMPTLMATHSPSPGAFEICVYVVNFLMTSFTVGQPVHSMLSDDLALLLLLVVPL